MVDALLCESLDDEKEIEKLVVSDIQSKLKHYNIENKHQWIFSAKT
jgi:hypothetical protein